MKKLISRSRPVTKKTESRGSRRVARRSVAKKTQVKGAGITRPTTDAKFPLRVPSTSNTVSFDDDDVPIDASGDSGTQIVQSEATPLTTESFESFCQTYDLNSYLLERLKHEGYEWLTRIQLEAIPRLLQGTDVMIRSQTGSGKTLAFVVPAIQRIFNLEAKGGGKLSRADGTRILVLAPTRELVNQTITVATKLSIPFPQIVVGAVTGGEKRKSEKARLRKGVTFLGCTVGRFCDHVDMTSSLVVDRLALLVLDEADRLLDMGFEKKLRWLVHKLRDLSALRVEADALQSTPRNATQGAGFQSVLVSATLTPDVQKLAEFLLRKDCVAWVGETVTDAAATGQTATLSIPTSVKQYYVEVTLKARLGLLMSILLERAQTGKVHYSMSHDTSVLRDAHIRLLCFCQTASPLSFII